MIGIPLAQVPTSTQEGPRALTMFLSLHGREGPGAVAHHPPLLAARIARIT